MRSLGLHRASPLPALVQLPVFVGLLHVLRSFDRPGPAVARNAAPPDYTFGSGDVASFLHARLGGAPRPAWVGRPQAALAQFGAERLDVVPVAVVRLVLLAVATHLATRPIAAAVPMLRRLPWVLPVGGLVLPFPVTIILYGLAQSVATVLHQRPS